VVNVPKLKEGIRHVARLTVSAFIFKVLACFC
jgi:hypothetical protein